MNEPRPVLVLIDTEADPVAGKIFLRRLVEVAADARAGSAHRGKESAPRTWFFAGSLASGSSNEQCRVLEHDLLGRAAVRLAVDKVICIGRTRAERAVWQGAVMEGSWGDEAILVADVEELVIKWNEAYEDHPENGDIVAIAGAIEFRRLLEVFMNWGLVVRQI